MEIRHADVLLTRPGRNYVLSVPNFVVQEYTDYTGVYGDAATDVFAGGATLDESVGGLDVPDDPGLGIEVDREAARRAFSTSGRSRTRRRYGRACSPPRRPVRRRTSG